MKQTAKKVQASDRVATAIDVLRTIQGKSPERCANAMGVSVSTFYRKLHKPATFTMADLESLARLFNTTVARMAEGVTL